MLRPKDVAGQLGISAPTLRVWSTQFAPVLSPAARPAKTESGGAAQRRYTARDLAYFRKAKEFLDSGSTFAQALERLQALGPAEFDAALHEPIAGAAASDRETSEALVAPVAIGPAHPLIQAFEEALRAKDETIGTLREALSGKERELETLRTSKDETIASLNARVDELANRPSPDPLPPAAPAVPVRPRLRWSWLNKLLTAETPRVG